jgi:hypothetical protein
MWHRSDHAIWHLPHRGKNSVNGRANFGLCLADHQVLAGSFNDIHRKLLECEARTPEAPEIHIVLDNLSAHKTETVRQFLERNPRVRFHFTPTADLSRKLMKYIRIYAKSAKPFRWRYSDPGHRVKVTE